MRPLHQAGSHELPALQMENELLGHETRHLRARLAQAEREIKRLKSGRASTRSSSGGGRAANRLKSQQKAPKNKPGPGKADKAARELKRYQEAHDDLRWLLGRLLHSPAGPILRRRAGFRRLCERYRVR